MRGYQIRIYKQSTKRGLQNFLICKKQSYFKGKKFFKYEDIFWNQTQIMLF